MPESAASPGAHLAFYAVRYEPEAERRLSRLPPEVRVEVQGRLENLADAPITERPGRTTLEADVEVDGTVVKVEVNLAERILRVLTVLQKGR